MDTKLFFVNSRINVARGVFEIWMVITTIKGAEYTPYLSNYICTICNYYIYYLTDTYLLPTSSSTQNKSMCILSTRHILCTCSRLQCSKYYLKYPAETSEQIHNWSANSEFSAENQYCTHLWLMRYTCRSNPLGHDCSWLIINLPMRLMFLFFVLF